MQAPYTPASLHPNLRRKHRVAAWIEICLWVIGCLALGYCAFLWGRARYEQAQGEWTLEHTLPGDPSSQGTPGPNDTASRVTPDSAPEGTLVGRIEIPRVNLSAIVFEGTSDTTLARGVGHLKGSGAPGERGNLALAGHRDSFFRELQNVKKGDQILIKSLRGEFEYRVDSTFIVHPTQTEVLKPGGGAILTLITCYPFRYIGNAPERFIVRATMVEKSSQFNNPDNAGSDTALSFNARSWNSFSENAAPLRF